MSNLDIWNRLHRPPNSALKEIGAGRLKGKSDINPQWRMKAMTEEFGPVGFGWSYSINKLWTEPGASGEVCAFATVSVKIQIDGMWGEPIEGVGGSTLVAKEKDGLRTNDEAYKMAVTDALSVALKAIGVAADIYLGNFDGSKYIDRPAENRKPASPATENKQSASQPIINKVQIAEIEALLLKTGADKKEYLDYLKVSDISELTENKYQSMKLSLEKRKK